MNPRTGKEPTPSRRLCIAPMLDRTDRHCRYFLRQLSRHCLLYTEMVTTGAILRGDPERVLAFSPAEHPVALQLGGNDPAELAAAARIGSAFGYDEINLNVGCPSERVSSGRFGACLMAEPALVADCVAAMIDAAGVPVTIKTRTGIDTGDSPECLHTLLEQVQIAGCRTAIIHARMAILGGLSPKQNRSIPPLRHDTVHHVKRMFPGLEVILNGGITDLTAATGHLGAVDGVMIGRAAWHDPWILAGVDARFYGSADGPRTRESVVRNLLPYIDRELNAGTALKHITRHLLGLYHGVPGARTWRRYLGRHATTPHAGTEIIEEALQLMNRSAGRNGTDTEQRICYG